MPDILRNPANYRKLWAYIVGFAVSWISRRFGFDLSPVLDAVVDLTLGLLTGFFIWLLPNVKKLFHIETVTSIAPTGEVTAVETTVAEIDPPTGEVQAVASAQVNAAPKAAP